MNKLTARSLRDIVPLDVEQHVRESHRWPEPLRYRIVETSLGLIAGWHIGGDHSPFCLNPEHAAAMLGWSIEDALLNHGRVHALSQMGSWWEGDGLGPPYPDEPRPIGTLVNVNGLDHTERPKDAASGDHWHVHRLGALVAAYRDVCMRLGAVT